MAAALSLPSSVAFDPQGNLVLVEYTGQRLRKVDRQGTISTLAGTGERGDSGDGGPARAARFHDPHSFVVTPQATEADLTYEPLPNTVKQVSTGDFVWLGDKFPDATKKVIADKTEELRKAVAALKEKKIADDVLIEVEIYLKAAENKLHLSFT